MQFHDFFKCLKAKAPKTRVEVELLRDIINTHHAGVGTVKIKYFPDFEGAQLGNFIWLDEDRTSAHEEAFNDALVFVNNRFAADRAMRRIISAKELMHVFDAPGQRASDPDLVRKLIQEINSKPISEDASEPYKADRLALWKATIALVPPWIRDEFIDQWRAGTVKAHELVARWWLPESVVSAAMGNYYEVAMGHVMQPRRVIVMDHGDAEDPNLVGIAGKA